MLNASKCEHGYGSVQMNGVRPGLKTVENGRVLLVPQYDARLMVATNIGTLFMHINI